MHEARDIVGIPEVAKRTGKHIATIHKILKENPHAPEPIADVSRGEERHRYIFSWSDWERFFAERGTKNLAALTPEQHRQVHE